MKIKRRKKKKTAGLGLDVTGGKPLREHYAMAEIADEKEIAESEQRGFFDVPSEIKGKTDFGIKRFLVFYFDSEEDYNVCVELFGKFKKWKSKNPPIVETKRLMKLIKGNDFDRTK